MVTNVQLIRIWNLKQVEPVVVRQDELTGLRTLRVPRVRLLLTTIKSEAGSAMKVHPVDGIPRKS